MKLSGVAAVALAQLMAVLLIAPAAAAPREDSLRPLAQCLAGSGFSVTSLDRWPASSRSRSVAAESGERAVSVDDGYRILLSWPDAQASLFANVKTERSVAGQFAADREAILSHMRQTAASAPANSVPLQIMQHGSIELLQLQNLSVARPGLLSMITLLDARTGLVVTSYMNNKREGGGLYPSLAEYERQRGRFVDTAEACIETYAAAAAAKP